MTTPKNAHMRATLTVYRTRTGERATNPQEITP